MTNHADHNHPATPACRRECRARTRRAIKTAQTAYMGLWAGVDAPSHDAYDNYYALVADVEFVVGCTLAEAYNIVENGPCV
jgi:hypothetical protein